MSYDIKTILQSENGKVLTEKMNELNYIVFAIIPNEDGTINNISLTKVDNGFNNQFFMIQNEGDLSDVLEQFIDFYDSLSNYLITTVFKTDELDILKAGIDLNPTEQLMNQFDLIQEMEIVDYSDYIMINQEGENNLKSKIKIVYDTVIPPHVSIDDKITIYDEFIFAIELQSELYNLKNK